MMLFHLSEAREVRNKTHFASFEKRRGGKIGEKYFREEKLEVKHSEHLH